MISCRGSIAKTVLGVLNATFIMISLAMILLGLQMKVQQTTANSFAYKMTMVTNMTMNANPYNNDDESVAFMGIMKWDRMSNLLIIIGAFLAIVSIFGFCAALSESSLFLNIYIYFLSIITCTVWIAIILILMFNGPLFKYGRHLFIVRMETFSNPTSKPKNADDYALFIQNFQQIFHCCGVESPNDWLNRTFGNISLGQEILPASCCSIEPQQQQRKDMLIKLFLKEESYNTCFKAELAHHDGCFSSIQIVRYRLFGQMILIVIIMLLALLVSLTCCLERDKRLQYSRLVNMQYATHLSGCRQGPYGLGYSFGRMHCPLRKSSVEPHVERNLKRTIMASMVEPPQSQPQFKSMISNVTQPQASSAIGDWL
ncbi:hypothetical protein HUG17_8511 [Dermatophagoides farinae]|nr:uncharacterized protein LOC124496149 [Dermatophagoides farinae]KAH7641042.1 hypothetical protein HUG17_8511 [Dermatophagoides farinae]